MNGADSGTKKMQENWIITSLSLNVGYTRDGVNQAPKTTVASYSAEDAETYAG